MKKKCCFVKTLLKLAAVAASVCGVLYIFQDSIRDLFKSHKEDSADDSFDDDFDDDFDDFDDDSVFDRESDREYVSINITDVDNDDSEEEEEEEEDDAN